MIIDLISICWGPE